MLKLIFRLISGYKNPNWFSRKFWKYYYAERNRREFEFPRQEEFRYYDVTGGGKLALSKSADFLCGDKVGFSIGVSWTMHPYIGGVLSRAQAKKLAEYILEQLSKCTDSEETEVANYHSGLNYNRNSALGITEARQP